MSKKYTAAMLQSCFEKSANKKNKRQEIAKFVGVTQQSLGNYFVAKKAYDEGREIQARNISMTVFSEWAHLYGEHGEPIYKKEDGTRKHRKKGLITEQTEIDFGNDNQKPTVDDLCEQEHVAKDPQIGSDPFCFPWEPGNRLFSWIKANNIGTVITPDGVMTLTAREELFETLFRR